MKNYFLGTSFLIDLIKKEKKALKIHEKIKGNEITGTPCIYELNKFIDSKKLSELSRNKIIIFNIQDAQATGKLYYELKKEGETVSEIDTIIAGMVKNRNLELVTRYKDFSKIKEIQKTIYEIKNQI